jgi:hypothetical protein
MFCIAGSAAAAAPSAYVLDHTEVRAYLESKK